MTVTLTRASAPQEPLLQNLIQLYTHDFSEFWAGTPHGDLLADGRFPPYPLDPYWNAPNWSAHLIWHDGDLAGFALVNDYAHGPVAVDRSVAEFFVVRKHRGGGVGRRAAERVFDLHAGSWEVAVARKNLPALAFWRRAIGGAAQASHLEESDVETDRWNGAILRFDWRAA